MEAGKVKAPAWTVTADRPAAFRRGVLEMPSTAAIVLFSTFIGFGVLARETGFSLSQAVFVTATVWALPGQVVMVDEIAKGALMAGTAFAVMLTAIRLLPLVVSVMPYLQDDVTPKWVQYPLSHFIAITIWVESMTRLPPLPRNLRVPYYLGFAMTLVTANIFATAIGFQLAGSVPRTVAAALLFLTPIYFFLSILKSIRLRSDLFAMAIGAVMGPALYLVAPGFDLILTGLIGGTLAYALARFTAKRGAP